MHLALRYTELGRHTENGLVDDGADRACLPITPAGETQQVFEMGDVARGQPERAPNITNEYEEFEPGRPLGEAREAIVAYVSAAVGKRSTINTKGVM